MTSRLTTLEVNSPSWVETVPVWREWLAFNIASSTMMGWWEDEILVSMTHSQVKATAFLHTNGLALIAIGNFANESLNSSVTVSDGYTIKNGTLVARAIQGFQPAATFVSGQPFNIPAKRGWMLHATILPAKQKTSSSEK